MTLCKTAFVVEFKSSFYTWPIFLCSRLGVKLEIVLGVKAGNLWTAKNYRLHFLGTLLQVN